MATTKKKFRLARNFIVSPIAWKGGVLQHPRRIAIREVTD
jgi:hypothetical protein